MDTLSASETASIKNILTLRYDPTMTTHVPKRTADDFLESSTCSVLKIESLIQSNIKNFVKNISENHFSVGLSGGIDSALTIAMLRKAAPDAKIDAISVRFVDSLDESETAKKIGQHFDADVHVINIENYLADLPEAISIIKYPFWDSHWFYVVKNAIRFSKNLLSGDGGDELFAGYTFRYEKFLSLYNQDMSAMKKTQLYMDCHQRDWVPDQDKIFGSKIKFEWSEIYKQILTNFDNSLGPLNQVFLADFNGKLLYNWIPINKSLHDHFGLNSLSPLLSAELISYATHLSPATKYNGTTKIGKIPLRELLSKYVPKEMISEEKHGFSVNTVNLWKLNGKDICEQYLRNGRIVEDGWINKEWIEKRLKTELDVRYVNKFFGLLAFEIWYRLFVTKEMKSSFVLK